MFVGCHSKVLDMLKFYHLAKELDLVDLSKKHEKKRFFDVLCMGTYTNDVTDPVYFQNR